MNSKNLFYAAIALSVFTLHAAPQQLINWGGTGMASADTNFSLPTPTDNGTTRTWEYSDSTALVATGGTYSGPAIYGALETVDPVNGPTDFTTLRVDDRGSNDDYITNNLSAGASGGDVRGLVFFQKSDFANLSTSSNITFDSNSSFSLGVVFNNGSGADRGPRLAVMDGSSWYVSDSVFQGFSATLTIADLSAENFASYDPTGAPLNTTPGSFGTAGSTFTDIQAVGYYFHQARGNSGTVGFNIDAFEITAVPEPSSLALMGLAGIAGMMIFRRRK